MKKYNWVNENSFGANLPDTWEKDMARINAALEEAGIPETGELTPDQDEIVSRIWEQYCSGELYWYAAVWSDDTAWDNGSYDREKAAEIVREYRDSDPDAYIAVIDESGREPMCVAEIHDMNLFVKRSKIIRTNTPRFMI